MELKSKKIAEAGFSHIHWCFDWTGDYIYSKAEMYQIREWMEKYGLNLNYYVKIYIISKTADLKLTNLQNYIKLRRIP